MTAIRPERGSPPEHWVPVDQRIAGIDRRTIAPAIAILVMAIVYSWVLPAVNHAVPYRDEIKAGDVLDLGDGRLTIVPAEGWRLARGVRVGDPRSTVAVPGSVALEDEGVSVVIATGPFDGTPKQFMTQLEAVNGKLDDVDGLASPAHRSTITTTSGITGVTRTSFEGERSGIAAAFVVEADPPLATQSSIGVEVLVKGSASAIQHRMEEITAMIKSLALEEGSA